MQPITTIRMVDETMTTINEQMERYIQSCLTMFDITMDEFAEKYLIEQYPAELVAGILSEKEINYRVQQKFRIRLKDEDERARSRDSQTRDI